MSKWQSLHSLFIPTGILTQYSNSCYRNDLMYSRPPGHHLMELTVGLFKTNSCVAGSYVAVVSSPLRCVPRERQHIKAHQTRTRTTHTYIHTFRVHSGKAKMNDYSAMEVRHLDLTLAILTTNIKGIWTDWRLIN